MCGNGVSSAGAGSGGTGLGRADSVCCVTPPATTEAPLEQPAVFAIAIAIGRARKSPNHQGHTGSRRLFAEFSFVYLRVLGGFIVLSGIVSAFRNQEPFFSARFLRCSGCTIQAMPVLRMYKPTMGAAKMHMFRISGVGVIMAATTKIPRME